jgi:two-component system, OmpR family, osmolarity sensor histidine kinase EnvZ
MRRGPTTFSLILTLLTLVLLVALGVAASLWVRTGGQMIGDSESRLLISAALAADELSTRSDPGARDALKQMKRLGISFSSDVPPPPGSVTTPMMAELARSVGKLVGDPTRVVLTQSTDPEIWIRSERDPRRWTMFRGASYRRQFVTSSLMIAGIAGFVALLLAILGARIITRPLEHLAQSANGWLSGDSMQQTVSGSPREVRRLAGAFGDAGERLRQAGRERELMLAGISHDLRTPLARLRLALELGDAADPQRTAAMAADLEQLDGALEQCLAFVRDGRDEALRRIDLATITGQLLTLRSHPEQWQLESPTTLYLECRQSLIRRAIGNLMDNAERYGAAQFEVALWKDADKVHIRIMDHGPGVAQHLLGNLGQPFWRGEAARGGGGGSGLGLSIVARAVQLHGGTLELRNIAGGGFETEICLPGGIT